jgi:hypothetical protein
MVSTSRTNGVRVAETWGIHCSGASFPQHFGARPVARNSFVRVLIMAQLFKFSMKFKAVKRLY